jgi:hypothetical protein
VAERLPGDLASTETARTVAVSSTVSFGSATPDACAEGGLEGVLPVPVLFLFLSSAWLHKPASTRHSTYSTTYCSSSLGELSRAPLKSAWADAINDSASVQDDDWMARRANERTNGHV